MSTIKLGQRPKNFKHPVKFKMLDGSEGCIECVYKYRTRTEFGQFVDELATAANKTAIKDGKFSMEALMESTRDSNADYMLRVLDGWDIDVELSRNSLQQLVDELPAAANAIMETYRSAIQEGRLGN